MGADADYAKRIFVHYFAQIHAKLGWPWNEDNVVEIEGAVDSIIKEAKADDDQA